MSLTLCTWTWIRVCACRCAYMSETHVDIVQRWTEVEGNVHRGHTRRHKLSLLTILPFLGLVYRTSGLRKVHLLSFTSSGSLCTCFRHERWDQYSVRRHKRGRNHKVCIFLENASVVCTCFSVPIASGWRPL